MPVNKRVVMLPGGTDIVELDLNDAGEGSHVYSGAAFGGKAGWGNIDSDCLMEDWREGLLLTVEATGNFHDPLTKYIGLAVRKGSDSDDEILAFSLKVIRAYKRDNSDLRKYRASEINRMIKGFRRNDGGSADGKRKRRL